MISVLALYATAMAISHAFWHMHVYMAYVKLQGHTALKIVEFDPNWAFPDCNSSLNSPMATKWCIELEVA